PDLDDVRDLALRLALGALHLRRLDRAAQEDIDLEPLPLRPDEEVADLAREHDAAARGIDALLADLDGSLAQALPRFAQFLRELRGERVLGRGPAVVVFAFFDPLLAVVALASRHASVSGSIGSQLARKPRPREPPVAHYGLRRDLEQRRGLLDAEPAEEP